MDEKIQLKLLIRKGGLGPNSGTVIIQKTVKNTNFIGISVRTVSDWQSMNVRKNICLNVKDKPKAFWSYIKSKTKTRDKICDFMQEVGELTSNNKEKAKVLNKFFSSVFTRENTENVPEMSDRPFECILDNITISSEEILKKLHNLNSSNAAGPDG